MWEIKIAIDLDGIIFNTHQIIIGVYNKKYKKNISIRDIDKWNFFTKKIFKKIYSKTCKHINEYKLLDLTTPYWLFLFNDKYTVDILTHQWNKTKKLEECLHRLGIRKGFEYEKIIKTKKKKVDYDYDLFVDDNPEMIYDIVEYTKKYLLLYNSYWNQSYDCNLYKNIFRVHNFRDISEKIEQLEKIFNYGDS